MYHAVRLCASCKRHPSARFGEVPAAERSRMTSVFRLQASIYRYWRKGMQRRDACSTMLPYHQGTTRWTSWLQEKLRLAEVLAQKHYESRFTRFYEGLLAAEEVRLRQAPRAFLQPDPDQAAVPRRGHRAPGSYLAPGLRSGAAGAVRTWNTSRRSSGLTSGAVPHADGGNENNRSYRDYKSQHERLHRPRNARAADAWQRAAGAGIR